MHNFETGAKYNHEKATKRGVKGFKAVQSVLIIDEVSMMTLLQLARLDTALRNMTQIDLDFGGLSVVLAGDFYQMPPVGNSMMYLEPTINEGSHDISV